MSDDPRQATAREILAMVERSKAKWLESYNTGVIALGLCAHACALLAAEIRRTYGIKEGE